LDIEPGWDDGEDDAADDEDKTKTKSRKSRASRASRVSKAKSKMSRATSKKSKIGKKSAAGKSSMSRASKRTAMSRTTTRTKKTQTALSKRENEDPQPMFLNISHFDKLFRIHSMLTYISYDQKEIALDAQFFIVKMWELSYKSLNAFNFLGKHKDQAEKLGFNVQDADARENFYNEVFTNPDVELPME
jgi:inorganic triphosphatase YgiF